MLSKEYAAVRRQRSLPDPLTATGFGREVICNTIPNSPQTWYSSIPVSPWVPEPVPEDVMMQLSTRGHPGFVGTVRLAQSVHRAACRTATLCRLANVVYMVHVSCGEAALFGFAGVPNSLWIPPWDMKTFASLYGCSRVRIHSLAGGLG